MMKIVNLVNLLGKEVQIRLPIGQIRVKTLIKALMVLERCLRASHIISVDDIAYYLGFSKGHAYSYHRFLRHLFSMFENIEDDEDEEDSLDRFIE
jgi:hypothetical protein